MTIARSCQRHPLATIKRLIISVIPGDFSYWDGGVFISRDPPLRALQKEGLPLGNLGKGVHGDN